jgi:hypothetical protein
MNLLTIHLTLFGSPITRFGVDLKLQSVFRLNKLGFAYAADDMINFQKIITYGSPKTYMIPVGRPHSDTAYTQSKFNAFCKVRDTEYSIVSSNR